MSSQTKLIEELIAKDKYTEALGIIEEIPDNELTETELFYRALCKSSKNNLNGAVKDLLDLSRSGSDYPYIDFTLGQIFEKQKDVERAIYYYRKATRFRETFKDAENALSFLSKFKEVDDASARIIELKPIKPDIKFKDVVGLGGVKQFLYENVVLPMKRPELLKKYGKKSGVGIMLFGPPGTGKTYITKALAGECNAYFLNVIMHQVLGEFVGATEKNLHRVFEQARYNSPCIMFFDELDALGGKRQDKGGDDEHGGTQTLRAAINQFLIEMDGIEKRSEGIFIISSTNMPWTIEPSLKRSGRLGDAIYIPAPTFKERMGAFKYNLRAKRINGHIDYERLARASVGYSQADIAAVCDKASNAPMLREIRTSRDSHQTTKDILNVIKKTPDTMTPWFMETKKQLIGRFNYQIVDGKKHFEWKSGSLEPSEKVQYRALINDVIRETKPINLFKKRLTRAIALYII